MILYQNSLMQLDFDPAKGLMVVNWPNFEAYSLADTKLALSRLVNTVKNYDVKMLLVDASNAKMELELEAYEEVVKHFIVQLLETSLEKIARVKTTDAARETAFTRQDPVSELYQFCCCTGLAVKRKCMIF